MKATIAADPQALRAAQPAAYALADAVARVTAGLIGALEAEGPCWGSGEWGGAFAAAYLPASHAVRSLLSRTGAAIDDLAQALAVAADVLATAEHEARRVA